MPPAGSQVRVPASALMEGGGQTDGEGIEQGWSSFNGLASLTKKMGPGSWHNTIDDHIGHHNW